MEDCTGLVSLRQEHDLTVLSVIWMYLADQSVLFVNIESMLIGISIIHNKLVESGDKGFSGDFGYDGGKDK